MKSKSKYIGVKELILSVVLSVIMIVISIVVALVGVGGGAKVISLYSSALFGLVCGPVYILMISKSPKIGTIAVWFTTYAIYLTFMGNSPANGIMTFVWGILVELMMLKGGYTSKWRRPLAYALFYVLNQISSFILFLVTRDSAVGLYKSAGMTQEAAEQTVQMYTSIYADPVNWVLSIGVTALACGISYWIGSKLLKKHFRPSGAV